MEALKTWTSSEGRLSRKGYALCFLLPGAGLIVFTWLVMAAAPDLFGDMPAVLFVAPWLAFLFTTDAQNIKRYHDIGNSGRLYKILRPLVIVLPLLALLFQFILPAHMAMAGDVEALGYLIGQDLNGWQLGPIPAVMIVLTLLGMVMNVVYLSIMPGKNGPNDYGPDPLSGVSLPGVMAAPAAGGDNDPVKRALAEYQARQALAAKRPRGVAPASGSAPAAFGRKRI